MIIQTSIKHFDIFLSRLYRIHSFAQDESCILRLQETNSPHAIQLPDMLVRAGEPVLEFHLWNERLPSPDLPAMRWAVETRRLFIYSLILLSRHVLGNSVLSNRKAIFGITSLFRPESGKSGIHPMQRLGFTVIPYHSPLGGFGEFWENFYAWWLTWAFNPKSASLTDIGQLRRTELWMSTSCLTSRYEATVKLP